MPHEGNKIKIPLKTEDAIKGLMKVKPTSEMPSRSKVKSKAKGKGRKK